MNYTVFISRTNQFSYDNHKFNRKIHDLISCTSTSIQQVDGLMIHKSNDGKISISIIGGNRHAVFFS